MIVSITCAPACVENLKQKSKKNIKQKPNKLFLTKNLDFRCARERATLNHKKCQAPTLVSSQKLSARTP